MPARLCFSNNVIDEIVNEYSNGNSSLNELARRFGVNLYPIRRILTENNVRIRTRSESAAIRHLVSPTSIERSSRKYVFQSDKMGCWIPTSSTFEYVRVQQLENDPDVVAFGRCRDAIPYVFEGSARHYNPDFYVEYRDGRRVVEEIKPFALVPSPLNVKKFLAAIDFYANSGKRFDVRTEIEIGTKEIRQFRFDGIAKLAEDEMEELRSSRKRENGKLHQRRKRASTVPTAEQRRIHAENTRDWLKRWMLTASDEQKSARLERAAQAQRRVRAKKKAKDNTTT